MSATTFDGVLVVGGGYAGVQAAVAARDAGAEVLLVDPNDAFTFTTRLAAVAGGTAPTSAATAPFSDFGLEVRQDCLTTFDDGAATLASGDTISAGALVIAAGSVPLRPSLPGVDELPAVRTAAQAIALRSKLGTAKHTVIIGAGATGVQLAGSITAARPEATVTLVDRDDLPLAQLGDRLGHNAARILERRGVRLVLGHSVEGVTPEHVDLEGGEKIEGDVIVWAAGFDADPIRLGTPPQRNGAIAVDACGLIHGCSRTFAAGDVADHIADGDSLPMSAQIAVQAGRQVGKNAATMVLRGDDPEPIQLTQRGWVMDLGGFQGVAKIGPLPLADPWIDRLAPLLHDAIDVKTLWEMGGLRAVTRHRPR